MGKKIELKIPEELYKMALEDYEMPWQSDKVVITRFTAGDVVDIERDSMEIKGSIGSTVSIKVNPADVQILTIMKGVLEAPWGANNVQSIRGLPPPVFQWVSEEINKFNTLEAKKKP